MTATLTPTAAGGDSRPSAILTPRVMGLDPSLTATGLAWRLGTLKIEPKRLDGLKRLRYITDGVLSYARDLGAELVVVEGFIPGKAQAGVHERGGLWWRLVDHLDEDGRAIASVQPQAIKTYATGKGNAGKDEVLLAAARRFDWFAGDNNEADALWLAAIGAELLLEPLVEMPAHNRKALEKVTRW